MKQIAAGVDDFRELMEGQYAFVDKSLFISDILKGGTKVTLITRPKGFGKSLNLSMLSCFLDRHEAEKTRFWFQGLKITHEGRDVWEHQGRYPVISISLKDVRAETFDSSMGYLKIVLSDLHEQFRCHVFDQLPKARQLVYERILEKHATLEEMVASLRHLSQDLHTTYQEKVVILIDEYDAPIHAGFEHGYYQQIVEVMRGLLSFALKDNEHLYKSVLTGILRVSKESVFSGLNNVCVYGVLQQSMGQHFGFTSEEIDSLLQQTGIQTSTDQLKHWYNGYRIGEYQLYNPWSIVCLLHSGGDFAPYWSNTANPHLIRQVLALAPNEIKMAFERLLQGDLVETALGEHVVFSTLTDDANYVWYLLLASGYLTHDGYQDREGRRFYRLKIPNLEVMLTYQELFQQWFSAPLGKSNFNLLLEALVHGREQELQDALSAICRYSLSYFDASGEQPERVYHAFVLGMSVALEARYQIRSNRESGYGRYDVMLIPKDLARPGVIIEFKQASGADSLEQTAAKALEQIKAKNYQTEFEQMGISCVISWGLAFKGKEVLVKRGIANNN